MSRLSELSVAEVEELILGVVTPEEYELDHWGAWDEVGYDNPFYIVPELGRVEVINHEGGGEGATDLEIVWRITSLEDGSTRLFIKTGCWVSHDGAYWDGDFRETTQKQKVVTYYE